MADKTTKIQPRRITDLKPWLVVSADHSEGATILGQYDTYELADNAKVGGYLMSREDWAHVRCTHCHGKGTLLRKGMVAE